MQWIRSVKEGEGRGRGGCGGGGGAFLGRRLRGGWSGEMEVLWREGGREIVLDFI